MNYLRIRIFALLLVVVMITLAACGAPSKEDVMKKLSGKWNDTKGYELQATMEIKTGSEPRIYDVDCLAYETYFLSCTRNARWKRRFSDDC